ncbi:Uncharacterized protein FKW44_021274, partial [Caligus rogercresseyi]
MGRGRQTAPYNVPMCMVFRPSLEEIQDFKGYMEYMESQGAHHAGIAKIILPEGWTPRKAGYALDTLKDLSIKRPIKQTFTNVGEDKRAFQTKSSSREPMSVLEYYEMSMSSTYRTPQHHSYEDLERKYWKSLSFVPPIYGADITDSITDSDCTSFNIAQLPSILNYVNKDQNESYAGVTTPYLYMGSWKTTFSWHVEDMDLYAINSAFGMPKTWYCVPPKHGHLLEKACRSLFPSVANWCSNFMRHKTCLINPSLLDELGVPYQKVVQEERNAIIVYPYAYHSGFNHGFNCAESTNFALERWVEYGKRYRPCDCSSNTVKINMDCFVKRFQPEIYEKWTAGLDIGPHPEDPPDVVALIQLKAQDPTAYASLMAEKIQKESSGEKLSFYTSSGRTLSVYKSTLTLVRENVSLSDSEKKEFHLWKVEQRNNSKIIFEKAGGPLVSADRRLVHIYQHVELSQLKVKVLPRTLTVLGDGLARLMSALPNERFEGIRDLIERGALIKIGERQMKRKRNFIRPEEGKKKDDDGGSSCSPKNRKRERLVSELRHTYMDLKAFVFSDDLDTYYGRQTDALTTVMEGSRMSTMVQNGTFIKSREFPVQVEEERIQENQEPKKDDEEIKYRSPPEGYEHYNVYFNSSSSNYIAFNPETLSTPCIPQQAEEIALLPTLISSGCLKLVKRNKAFQKDTKYTCTQTPLRRYYHKGLQASFYTTQESPSRLYSVGRLRHEIKAALVGANIQALEAEGSVVFQEYYIHWFMSKKKKKRSKEYSVQKYILSNSNVKVEVIHGDDKILYRLPFGNEDLQETLIKWDLDELIRRAYLIETCPPEIPLEQVARLRRIYKCEMTFKQIYRFRIRKDKKHFVFTDEDRREFARKPPDALRNSPIPQLIQSGEIYGGEKAIVQGEGTLKKLRLGESSVYKDFEISHRSNNVHIAKNPRNGEIILIKERRQMEQQQGTTEEESQVECLPGTSMMDDATPETPSHGGVSNSGDELILREDEEVDEADYDDIENSEEEDDIVPLLPEEEEEAFSEEKGSEDEGDPDYRLNQPLSYKPSPALKRSSKKKKTRRRRGGGKRMKGEKVGDRKQLATFSSQEILLEEGEVMVEVLNQVLVILEESKVIWK